MSTNGWSPTWWTGLVPTSLLPSWPTRAASAPQNLDQPILPGWIVGSVVNVTEENSAAPEAEAAILRTNSYGRQLGQITDALQVLIDDRARAGATPNDALDKFVAMRTDIDKVKAATATTRINQLGHDLEILKHHDKPMYERLRVKLLRILD